MMNFRELGVHLFPFLSPEKIPNFGRRDFLFFPYRLSCKTWRASWRHIKHALLSMQEKRIDFSSSSSSSSSPGSRKTVISFSQTPSKHTHTRHTLYIL
jgi:hypothetical protein